MTVFGLGARRFERLTYSRSGAEYKCVCVDQFKSPFSAHKNGDTGRERYARQKPNDVQLQFQFNMSRCYVRLYS